MLTLSPEPLEKRALRLSAFTAALGISLIFHFILFALLMFAPFSKTQKAQVSSEAIFRKVLKAVNEKFPDRFKEMMSSSNMPNIELNQNLSNIKILDSNLHEEKQVEIFRDVLLKYLENPQLFDEATGSLEISASDLLDFLKKNEVSASGYEVFSSAGASDEKSFQLSILDKKKSRRLERRMNATETVKELFKKRGDLVHIEMEGYTEKVPAEYFYRDSPFNDILAEGPQLFFAVSGFPDLWEKDLSPAEAGHKTYGLQNQQLKDVFNVVLITDSGMINRLEREGKYLSLSHKNKQDVSDILQSKVLDELMSYPEEEQLRRFQQQYLTPEKLNDRETADFTLKFFRSNLNNILIQISDISNAFDYVEEIYFNKAIESRLIEFIQTHMDTRVGLEFVLFLASQYRFERKALMLLSLAYEEARTLLPRRMYRSEIHNKKAKCFIIKEMYEQLVSELNRLGYETIDEAARQYAREEKKLYGHLVSLGGEKGNIGLLALGRFYWRFDLKDLAITTWKKISDSYSTPLLDEIRLILSDGMKIESTYTLIDMTLNSFDSRNSKKLLDRLVRFGRWNKRGEI